MSEESIYFCSILPKDSIDSRARDIQVFNDNSLSKSIKNFGELHVKLASALLKNFAGKFEEGTIPETSSYVEIISASKRFVFKKTSLCWLFRNESYKCSSDRRYRVMNPIKCKKKKNYNVKKSKTHTSYKRFIPKKRLAKQRK